MLVPKSDGTYQLCTDFRKLNAVTRADLYPLPRIEDFIDHVGKSKICDHIRSFKRTLADISH